jgi:2-amino-4-hydroxy-6-hydroxymethyldihydropteridine diphosphokinase
MPPEAGSPVPPSIAFLGLGSNLGDRETNLKTALARLQAVGVVRGVSPFYETSPVGLVVQPDFLNAVVRLEPSLTPLALLDAMLGIERALGRDRSHAVPKGPRTLDLDLLDYDGQVVETPHLTLPHPELAHRAFVLQPLADLAPDWQHPVLRLRAEQMLRALQRRDPGQAVRPFHLS